MVLFNDSGGVGGGGGVELLTGPSRAPSMWEVVVCAAGAERAAPCSHIQHLRRAPHILLQVDLHIS